MNKPKNKINQQQQQKTKEREQNKEKVYRNNVVVDYCGYVLGIYICIYIYIYNSINDRFYDSV